ncbi:hypothetical protein TNCV_375971 [Trichonephila clavipes]|nr:hypothetical protein TNCV_375971 [Trichonephila clavipes]
MVTKLPKWVPKSMPTELYFQYSAKLPLNRPYKKIPEGSEFAKMVANYAKMVANVAKFAPNLVAKNDANLALPPRFRQVLIESPL